MSSELFIEDFIKPLLYLTAFGFILCLWGLTLWHWYQAQCTRRQEASQEEVSVQEPHKPQTFPAGYSAIIETEYLIEAYWHDWKEQVKDE